MLWYELGEEVLKEEVYTTEKHEYSEICDEEEGYSFKKGKHRDKSKSIKEYK